MSLFGPEPGGMYGLPADTTGEHVHWWTEVDLLCPEGDPDCEHPGLACVDCPATVDLIKEPDPRGDDE